LPPRRRPDRHAAQRHGDHTSAGGVLAGPAAPTVRRDDAVSPSKRIWACPPAPAPAAPAPGVGTRRAPLRSGPALRAGLASLRSATLRAPHAKIRDGRPAPTRGYRIFVTTICSPTTLPSG